MCPLVEHKYKIKERMDALPHHEHHAAMRLIPKALLISQRTFLRYMYTRIDDKYSMPVDHLARLAKYFNCRIEDMLNYDPPPLTGISIKKKDKIVLAKKSKIVK